MPVVWGGLVQRALGADEDTDQYVVPLVPVVGAPGTTDVRPAADDTGLVGGTATTAAADPDLGDDTDFIAGLG